MARNRVARRGPVTILSTPDWPVDTWADELVRLHTARWHSRSETGVLSEERVQRFHREALPVLVEHGLARLFALLIGGRAAGIYYGFHYRRRAYAYLGGFDPVFAFESPGTILLGHAIEQAVREGAREFHFLRGGEGYKYEWGAADRWTWRRTFRRRGDNGR
jgi:CelD/BcsL family acetyltransferase involved in cellulose biosynthesis